MTPFTEFTTLRLRAAKLLDAAAQLATLNGLSDIEIRQVQAAAGLAGVTFHKISIHGADPTDYQSVEDDLRHIARKVEPLIEAIGGQAADNSVHGLERAEFKDVVTNGLENAISDLRHAADRAAEDAEPERSDFAEHSTMHRAYQGV